MMMSPRVRITLTTSRRAVALLVVALLIAPGMLGTSIAVHCSGQWRCVNPVFENGLYVKAVSGGYAIGRVRKGQRVCRVRESKGLCSAQKGTAYIRLSCKSFEGISIGGLPKCQMLNGKRHRTLVSCGSASMTAAASANEAHASRGAVPRTAVGIAAHSEDDSCAE